jgi:hypothetical protein
MPTRILRVVPAAMITFDTPRPLELTAENTSAIKTYPQKFIS